MRRVDKVGRIVIPLELRKKHGLSEGVKIEFVDADDGVVVRSSEPFCRICRTRISDGATIPLCEACIEEAARSYNGKDKARSSIPPQAVE